MAYGEAAPARRTTWLRRAAHWLSRAVLALAALLAVGWGALALSIDGPGSVWAAAYALLSLVLPIALRGRRLGWVGLAALFGAVLAWWLSLAPSNDRTWQAEVSRLPALRIEGQQLTVSNLRDFEHRSEQDSTPRWEDRRFDLDQIVGLDLAVCDWGEPLIVHTILSWEFAGGEHLAISIETRKEEGESYSALRGFFRQFELYYAVADERDVIGVRALVRGERVRLYRLATPREHARALLLDYARTIERLARQPAWYNALTDNCTTSIRLHAIEIGVERPWNWRILINGYGEELLYLRGMVSTALPFEQVRAQSDVTEAARAAYGRPDFSRLIRVGLPARPGGP